MGSVVEIEYTLNVHLMYPHTLSQCSQDLRFVHVIHAVQVIIIITSTTTTTTILIL